MQRNGFMLLEALLMCALLLMTWFVVTQGAVQAIVQEQRIQLRARALIIAQDTLEHLRTRLLSCKNQTFTRDTMQVAITCQKLVAPEGLCKVWVKVLDAQAAQLVALTCVVRA